MNKKSIVLREDFKRKSYRNLRLAQSLQTIVGSFLNFEFGMPITIHKTDVSKDLKNASFTFTMPPNETITIQMIRNLQKSCKHFQGVSVPENLNAVAATKIILQFLNNLKHELNIQITKKVYIKRLPEIRFVLMKDDPGKLNVLLEILDKSENGVKPVI